MERPSMHHIFWTKNNYKTPLEKRFRNHKGLVVPMYEEGHKELHYELDPPPKPKNDMMIAALGKLTCVPDITDHPQVILAMSEHFLSQDHRIAQRIGHHLLKQAGFIQEGYFNLKGGDGGQTQ